VTEQSESHTRQQGVFFTLDSIYNMMVEQGKELSQVKTDVGKIPDNAERLNDHGKRINAIEGKMQAHGVYIGIMSVVVTSTIAFIVSRVLG